MNSSGTIQVFEHQKLYWKQVGPFKQEHWRALARFADKNGEEYFKVLGNGIKFSNYVGVIQAGSLTIEILPKVDQVHPVAANESETGNSEIKKQWHGILIQMLQECKLLKPEKSNYSSVQLKPRSLMDIYLLLFLDEVEQIIHQGLIKKYRRTEGNKLALSGKLIFSKNIIRNTVHKERFYVSYTRFDQNNIYNQILWKALVAISKISNSSIIKDKLSRIIFQFPEVDDLSVNHKTLDTIFYNRKTESYREAINIARMILLNYQPDITGGSENVVSFLIDMNKLWEEFIYRRLAKETTNMDFKVSAQSSKTFWHHENRSIFKKVRPDITISYSYDGKEEVIILDTKWKRLIKSAPSDDDLKQMFVYNLLWKCKSSFLIYPSDQNEYFMGGYNYERKYLIDNQCAALAINIINEKNKDIDKDIGRKILNRILSKEVIEHLHSKKTNEG